MIIFFQYPQKLLDSFLVCDDIDDCLKHLTLDANDDLAVGVSRRHAMCSSLFTNHDFFCFDRGQNIANYTISLAIRNDIELISNINKVIRRVLEGGLVVKWQREIRINAPLDGWHQAYIFNMGHISIVFFMLYFPGILLSTATLLLEIFVARKMNQGQRASGRKFCYWEIYWEIFLMDDDICSTLSNNKIEIPVCL